MALPYRLLTACLILATFTAVSASAAISRSAATPGPTMVIDGTGISFKAWRGGDLVAPARATGAAAGGLVKQQPGASRVEPLELEVSLPFEGPLATWFADFCSGNTVSRSLVLYQIDGSGVARLPALSLTGARLVEVRLPALAAGLKEPVTATLTVQAGGSQHTSTIPANTKPALSKVAKKINGGDFRLTIPGLETGTLKSISALALRQDPTSPREFTVLLHGDAVPGWHAWYDDFVVRGNSSDPKEKTGKLEFLDPTGATVLTLQFSGLGLQRLAPGSDPGNLQWEASLYFEGLAVTGAPTATANSPVAVGSEAANQPDPPPNPQPPASPPENTARPTSADAGERDPKDFPRPEGTVRQSFRTTERKADRQEFVVYETKRPLGEIAEFYTRSLAASGWKPLEKYEKGSDATGLRQILMNWTGGKRWTQITLNETKAGPLDIQVRIDTAP